MFVEYFSCITFWKKRERKTNGSSIEFYMIIEFAEAFSAKSLRYLFWNWRVKENMDKKNKMAYVFYWSNFLAVCIRTRTGTNKTVRDLEHSFVIQVPSQFFVDIRLWFASINRSNWYVRFLTMLSMSSMSWYKILIQFERIFSSKCVAMMHVIFKTLIFNVLDKMITLKYPIRFSH